MCVLGARELCSSWASGNDLYETGVHDLSDLKVMAFLGPGGHDLHGPVVMTFMVLKVMIFLGSEVIIFLGSDVMIY